MSQYNSKKVIVLDTKTEIVHILPFDDNVDDCVDDMLNEMNKDGTLDFYGISPPLFLKHMLVNELTIKVI